jgi:hypothetical protein
MKAMAAMRRARGWFFSALAACSVTDTDVLPEPLFVGDWRMWHEISPYHRSFVRDVNIPIGRFGGEYGRLPITFPASIETIGST